MHKLITFWYVFRQSLTSFSYYRELRKSRFSFSLKYFAGVLFLVTVIGTIANVIQFSLVGRPIARQLPVYYHSLVETFPEDAEVVIKQGVVSVSPAQPIPLGRPFRAADGQSFTSYVLIDPASRPEDYDTSRAFLLVTRDAIIAPGNTSSGYEELPFPNSMDATLNRSELTALQEPLTDAVTSLLKNWHWISIILTPLLISLGTMSQLVSGLVVLAILTAIMLLLTMMLRQKYTYVELYKFGMHAMTPVLIFQLLPIIIPPLSTEWSILLYMAWMTGAILTNRERT